MSARFEELDWRETAWGEISLRRRWDARFEQDVYEVKLDDDFLMSSLFTVGEVQLARLALGRLVGTNGLRVAVGGLGLGYTARAVLEYPEVESLVVVEALDAVIDWHRRELVPAATALISDGRCRFVPGDFFALVDSPAGLDPDANQPFHAIVVDIDHAPRHVLRPDHATFYEPAGLRRLTEWLCPGGVFALWSNDPPDDDFTATLGTVFAHATAEVVRFHNPLQEREASNTVYVATTAPE